MCGLFGYFVKDPWHKSNNRRNWVAHMAYLMALRGVDGTGAAFIDKNKNSPIIVKSIQPSYSFIDSKEFNRQLDKLDKYECFIGHTRKATVGGLEPESSHPFWSEPVVSAHNGTLREFHKLDGNAGLTDSHRLGITLGNKAPDYPGILKHLKGAFALTWFDMKQNMLFLSRNDERSLYYAPVKDGVYWASEAWMLRGLLDRCELSEDKMEIFYPAINNIVRYYLEAGNLKEGIEAFEPVQDKKDPEPNWQRFFPAKSKSSFLDKSYPSKKIPKDSPKLITLDKLPKIGDTVFFEVDKFERHQKNNKIGWLTGHYICPSSGKEFEVNDYKTSKKLWDDGGKFCDYWKGKILYINPNKFQVEGSIPMKDVDLINLYTGPDNKLYASNEMEAFLQDGCATCHQPIKEQDLDALDWDKNFNPICPDCQRRSKAVYIHVV